MADVRILLTDKTIARLPTPKEGWYLARDMELKGFFVVVGKRKRTFTVQGDLRQGGKRASSIRRHGKARDLEEASDGVHHRREGKLGVDRPSL